VSPTVGAYLTRGSVILAAGLTAACSTSHAIEFVPSPTELHMPSIGVSADVVPVVADDRVLDVPDDPRVVGWWSAGASPGDAEGTVVMDVHLDTAEAGEGPFAAVHDLEVGDSAEIVGFDGGTHTYQVTEVSVYDKTVLPYAELFRQEGPPQAVLVTCGGRFDPVQGWDSNVVVVMSPQ
jgi:sortase (surface protein transpeptidase)